MSTPRRDPLYLPDVTENVWRLDQRRSQIGFLVQTWYGLRTIKGEFQELDGTLDLQRDPAIELLVNAATLTTGNLRHDERFLSADFLHVEHQPTITFTSTAVTLEDEHLTIQGELSAAARTIPLDMTATFWHEEGELVLDAAVEVDHRALGMTWNPLGDISRHTRVSAKARLIRE